MSAKDISGKRPNQKRYSDHYYGPKKIQRSRIELRIEENVWLNGCVPYPIYSNVAKKRSTSCGYWKPHKCLICKKAFCHEDSLKQHSVDVHDEKKAPISKKKKSKKKNKHLKDKNVEDISDHYYGIGHLKEVLALMIMKSVSLERMSKIWNCAKERRKRSTTIGSHINV